MTRSPSNASQFKLNHSAFQALMTTEGLYQIDADFLTYLESQNALLAKAMLSYRDPLSEWSAKAVSDFIIDCSPYLDSYIGNYFGITDALEIKNNSILSQDPVFQFKKTFVQIHAKRMQNKLDESVTFDPLNKWLNEQLHKHNFCKTADLELAVASLAVRFLSDKDAYQADIDKLVHWCVRAQQSEKGRLIIAGWQSFRLPNKRNYENLVQITPVPDDPFSRFEGPVDTQRQRDGFKLTDQRMSEREVVSEINYCVYCHKTEGDFCSKGFPVKKNKPELGLKINPTGDVLTGCPLEEKISEMHVAKKSGQSIGALAIIMIDNPMCAATGHRICNDCMKSCIYQKQDPVDIPQVETRVLTDVLDLPWGVEIYDLMMRWNPLRRTQYLPKPYNGKKVLVMGMGPAGFTMAHHLLMEGCAVVGADGLKIEPLNASLLTQPIRHFEDIREPLDDRIMAGFGGVAEYGITVRWDKNFLKLIYISLARRALFQVFGGVRFGGTITVESAWELGFDHISIAVGAGLPRELSLPNSLAPGMRQANDFLMALQLTGAIKESSLTNLQVRLPAVVIGGGLTGIDTATEVQAYYITQVEKTHLRYTLLKSHLGEAKLREQFDSQSLEILDEFLEHAALLLAERTLAAKENREPKLTALIRAWGGVSIVYRKSMQESPAYKRNHEEIIKALEEGIYYAEGLEPKAVELDVHGAVNALLCRWRVQDEEGNWMFSSEEHTVPAKAIFVATGAKPNVAYAFEHRGTLEKKNMNYLRCELVDDELKPIDTEAHIKSKHIGIFTTYDENKKRVSFIGDTHPVFHGSVVKAIASAKRSYPDVMQSMRSEKNSPDLSEYNRFRDKLTALFEARVVAVDRLSDRWLSLTVRAPIAAAQFAPGQFYRIQNFEMSAPNLGSVRLQTEAVSALGILDTKTPGQLKFLIKETGASTRMVSMFQPGQPLALMGPSGVSNRAPKSPEKILIVGDQMSIPYLLSVGELYQEAGCTIYFVCQLEGGATAPFCDEDIAAITAETVWISSDDNLVDFLASQSHIPLNTMDSLMVIGAAQLLKRIQLAKKTVLADAFKSDIKCIASIYGPMQCMLKGVCAQCLQWQIDPETGERTKAVYACSWQHQPMDIVDMDNLADRLGQNKMQETLTNLWLDYLLDQNSIQKV